MTTRAELSEKSKYWIPKHRYYELKHFCLQYDEWKKLYLTTDGFEREGDEIVHTKSTIPGDPTFKCVAMRELYLERMDLVKRISYEADPDLASYIFKGVTEGLSFNQLKARLEIPCGRDMYYDRYRRFFWLLDQSRE